MNGNERASLPLLSLSLCVCVCVCTRVFPESDVHYRSVKRQHTARTVRVFIMSRRAANAWLKQQLPRIIMALRDRRFQIRRAISII